MGCCQIDEKYQKKNIKISSKRISNNVNSLNKKSKDDKNKQNDNMDEINYPIPEINIIFENKEKMIIS